MAGLDTAGTRRPAPPGDEPDPRRWRALSVTLVAGFMSLLDVSIVSVALPSLQQSLGTSPAMVQWVVSGYAVTFGLALVPAGRGAARAGPGRGHAGPAELRAHPAAVPRRRARPRLRGVRRGRRGLDGR